MDMNKDKEVLRELAKEYAQYASSQENDEKAKLWCDMNSLKMDRPMVWINEIPWQEMNVDDELTLRCTDKLARRAEETLRKALYQWKHMRGDMVLDTAIYSPLILHSTGFGISEKADIVKTEENNPVVSRHFNIQIKEEEDIEKIKTPIITYDEKATKERFEWTKDIFDGIMPVEKRGTPGFWFAPWDNLIRWWGVEQAMMDLVLRPGMVNKAMTRYVDAYLSMLDQYEKLGLLASNNNNTRVGSGGYAYVEDMKKPELTNVKTMDMWGNATAQIFSDVSPEMHMEFALRHEMRWLKRFKYTYYGCCEPLHNKLDILDKVPNLRKVSCSPWCNLDVARERINGRYVMSCKPSPAIFATDRWEPDVARNYIREILEKTKGQNVEIIMKDISTVRHAPQRLWEWEKIAMEEVERFR